MQDDLTTLSMPEKRELALAWLNRGEKVSVIASRLGVSLKTVYQWRKHERDEHIQELEVTRHIEVFAEQLAKLQDYENMCLRLAHRIQNSATYDPETGQMVSRKGSIRDLSELMRLVLSFRQEQIKLYSQVGIIPKQAEKIYSTLAESQISEQEDSLISLNRGELEALTIQKIRDQYIL